MVKHKEASKAPAPRTNLYVLSDLLLALVVVALHPSAVASYRAFMTLCALTAVVLPVPLLRFVLLAFGAAQARTTPALLPFFLAGAFWVLVGTMPRGARRTPALWVSLAALSVSACTAAFLSFSLLDQLAPPLGRIFHLAIFDYYSRVHLSAVAAVGLATALLVQWAVQAVGFRHGRRLLAYLEVYLACKRQLRMLGKKWRC